MDEDIFLMRAKHQSEIENVISTILENRAGTINLDAIDDLSIEDLEYIGSKLAQHGGFGYFRYKED